MSFVEWAQSGPIVATIVICGSAIPLNPMAFRKEFFGTIVMIACTFSAGKWWGLATPEGWPVPADWLFHWAGVVIADYLCGGPQVNPGVASSMLALGKIDYPMFACHVAAQVLGAVIGFKLLQDFAGEMGWNYLGGPQISATISGEELRKAAFHEFLVMFLLLLVIYLVNWEPSPRMKGSPAFYPVKQSLTAFTIRALIYYFGAAGPAINPALATGWVVYETGAYPDFSAHYLVYWVASISGALAASFLYTVIKRRGGSGGAKETKSD